MMEIERKFLIREFPNLPLLEEALVFQGYLSASPVVRIRSKQSGERTTYVLCFKGKGTLSRKEIEMPLTRGQFEELSELLEIPMIRKEYRVYQLPGGLKLECSLVDRDEETSFLYAEVEFHSVEEARQFHPPRFLGREVTEEPGYSMSSYWSRKKEAAGKKTVLLNT